MNEFSRRRFLQMAGLAGGAAAMLEAATALGITNAPEAWAGPPPLRQGSGAGKTVLVLGAGIGGLTACYELSKAGYHCVILEAQHRAGGRSLTVRNGDVVTERTRSGELVEQKCQFDEGLYANLGPGRIPHHHLRAIHYCRELGVPLEPYIMHTTANLFQNDDGFGSKALTCRQIGHDTRGRLAELLALAVSRGALDTELPGDDRERLLSLLRTFGGIDKTGRYPGSDRGGSLPSTPDVYEDAQPNPPMSLRELLSADFWRHRFYQPDDYLWQPTLFQPVGGMDQIARGFLAKLPAVAGRPLGDIVKYGHVVERVRVTDAGVEVGYRDAAGAAGHMKADYCVSNIPLPILRQVRANFSDDFRDAVRSLEFAPAFKVAWQANRRFWENDYGIYGGISWMNHPITQMWYPSSGFFSAKGTLTGAYTYDDHALMFGKLSVEQRLATARKAAIRLHKEFSDEAIVPTGLGVSIAWHQVPYQAGGWPEWTDTPQQRKAYARILAPEAGRFYIVGDQASRLPGWKEGAMTSAQHVVEQIGGLRRTEAGQVTATPISSIVVGAV